MKRYRILTDYAGMFFVLAVMVVAFGLSTESFFSAETFRNIANQIPDAMVVAVGMTFVMILGGIDLSVGSIVGLSGAVLGVCMSGGLPLVFAIPICLLAGALCGAINGFTTIRWQLPSFIVTLGMLEAARGAAYLITHSQTQYIGQEVEVLTDIGLFGLSLPFLIALVVVIGGQTVLAHTRFGRYSLATGANAESARLSGLPTRWVTFGVFTLSGLLSAVAGVIQCARLGAADPNAGIGFELQVIAAVVIGGTSLMGGRGSVINSFFGVLIIAVLGVGLFTLGTQESTKRLVTGCVIVAAVILDYYRHRLNRTA